jgi:hypothetical protein
MPRANPDGSMPNALAAARAKAKSRPDDLSSLGVDWPNIDDVSFTEALEMFEIWAYSDGLKVSIGSLKDGTALFCRLSFPKWADSGFKGLTTIAVSDSLEKAVRKAYAHTTTTHSSVWKIDQYAS